MFLAQLEESLIQEYNNILEQEELYWFQHARTQWIANGERNTKYFHLMALIKRRRKSILALKNDDGSGWMTKGTSVY